MNKSNTNIRKISNTNRIVYFQIVAHAHSVTHIQTNTEAYTSYQFIAGSLEIITRSIFRFIRQNVRKAT